MLPIYNLTKGHYVWYIREGEKFSKHTKSFYSINLLHRTKENNNRSGIYPPDPGSLSGQNRNSFNSFHFGYFEYEEKEEKVEYLLYCDW